MCIKYTFSATPNNADPIKTNGLWSKVIIYPKTLKMLCKLELMGVGFFASKPIGLLGQSHREQIMPMWF